MTRSQMREHVFNLLFQVEFNLPEDMDEQCQLYFQNNDADIKTGDINKITKRFNEIMDKLDTIDSTISEKTKGWTINRMGKVDLALLRIGTYEILFDEKLASEKSINEVVELAKKYGQDNSYSFINGVLARILPKEGNK